MKGKYSKPIELSDEEFLTQFELLEEITSLKRNMRFYETPKIEYSNLEEWEQKKKKHIKL